VYDVGRDVGRGEQEGATAGLGHSELGEVAVVPPGELVGGVPLALAVAEEDEGRHDGSRVDEDGGQGPRYRNRPYPWSGGFQTSLGQKLL